MLNLKEAFRMSKYLDGLLHEAHCNLSDPSHCLKTTKTHLRKEANPEAEDKSEEVDNGIFHAPDDVLAFMIRLTDEKEKLGAAITEAKANCGIDIDAEVEANKYRQTVRRAAAGMLRFTAAKKLEKGMDFKFNVEGNQSPYQYTVEVNQTENYDREKTKTISKEIIEKADEVSRKIDTAVITAEVKYEPIFSVNDSFDDAMEIFLAQE